MSCKLSWDHLSNLSRELGDSFYLLDTQRFENNYDKFLNAFQTIYPKTSIGYSYKTNYLPSLCKLVNTKGGYAEVVSEMEYDLARKCGARQIIVNGPYKTEAGLRKFLAEGSLVNIDSLEELSRIEKLAPELPNFRLGIRCNFPLSGTSRFGIDIEHPDFLTLPSRIRNIPNARLSGFHCHFPHRNLESFSIRTSKVLEISEMLFPNASPDFIDIGGGFCGKMPNSLAEQFDYKVPNYEDYAKSIATEFKTHFGESGPDLILEPGSALVADTMCFVATVVAIKTISGEKIAMSSGSRFNVSLLSSTINLPLEVVGSSGDSEFHDHIDISGYTCIESDYLYKGFSGKMAAGDFLVFSNVGSYSLVFKPPFILPNVPIIDYNSNTGDYRLEKRLETVDDIFQTYIGLTN